MPDNIVELKPRPRGRVTVKLAGGRFFTIPQEAVRFGVGAVLADEEIVRIDRMDQYFRGKDKALRMISRRMRTRRQVAESLEKMDLDRSVRGGILAELEEAGLIDDLRFAREYVKVKRDVRGLGPFRLRHDLVTMGVRKAFVDTALGESFDEGVQERMARELAGRRAGGGSVDERGARRVADHLRRKGFDFEIVNRVVHELLHRTGTQDDEKENG